ncbi:MAG: hypothetical protein QXL54_04830 [Candidatus Bathyarchaeia archaeon]
MKKAKSGRSRTELMRDVELAYMQSKQFFSVNRKGCQKQLKKPATKTSDRGLEFLKM